MKKYWDNPAEHAMPAHARVPAEMRIDNVRIAPATVLAPMAGVTDTVFRRFIKNASVFSTPAPLYSAFDPFNPANALHAGCHPERSEGPSGCSSPARELRPEGNAPESASLASAIEASTTNQQSGCGLIMTEFTSADGLSRMRESKRKRYLTYYDDEHPISAQLFGSNPQTLADSARICQDAGFDIVDLNLGCPAKRVVACNGGSGLLRDLPLIATIFEAVRAAVSIPFTVKFRMGWNDDCIVCVELARLAENCGLNAVALHARTREDGYSGQARWEYIAAVKDAVRIPVIGNGDVRTPGDACEMIDQTGCDAVMIGRAAPSNPWIFRQIAQYTETGRYDQPTDQDRYHMIRTYFEMLIGELAVEEATDANVDKARQTREGVGKMKQFASWFTHGVPGGAALRKAIYEAKTGASVLSAVDGFFEARLSGALIDIASEEAQAEEEMLASTAAYCT